ncbi:MAG: outer membrane protein assembly factor BamD [Legionellales bacterium RIFCSPHIGHO2_12_FULL_35_11]|nr:MAG: outer membrane protein assembly factor BamD [Legionellales bacterium RIFCSPHIGHO2_12_FULL_35_11]
MKRLKTSSKIISRTFLACIIFSSLTACKHWWSTAAEDEKNPFAGMSAKQLYNNGLQDLSKKQYSDSIKKFEALDTMYPFNDYAEQAQLNLIYAYYEKDDFPSSAATAERFIHLYPRSKRVDYAHYMKGMANFNQVRGALATILPMDLSWRDPGTMSQSYSDFATLVQRFPQSQYKPNALQHMIYLRNMFAQRELNTALYQYERKMFVAAIERANYLLRTYPTAPSAKEALAIVYYADLNLGLEQAAEDNKKVYIATYHSEPKQIKQTL